MISQKRKFVNILLAGAVLVLAGGYFNAVLAAPGDITWGAEKVFQSGTGVSNITITAISLNKILIAYLESSFPAGKFAVCNINADKTVGDCIVSDQYNGFVSPGQDGNISITVLNKSDPNYITFVVASAFPDQVSGLGRMASCRLMSGTTINCDNYVSANFSSKPVRGVSVATLDQTHFVVAYEDKYDSDGNGYDDAYRVKAKIGTVSGSSITYSDAGNNTFISYINQGIPVISAVPLSSSKFAVAYGTRSFLGDTKYYGGVAVGDANISNGTINFGQPYQIPNNPKVTSVSISALDATTFVMAYQKFSEFSLAENIDASVGTVSGNTVTFQTSNMLKTVGWANYHNSRYLSLTALPWFSGSFYRKFVAAYTNESDYGQALSANFLPYTITTTGNTSAFGTPFLTSYVSTAALDFPKFAVAYSVSGNGTVRVGEIALSPPSVETNTAMPVAGSSATLNGNITANNEGPSDIRGFEWGTVSGSYPNSWTEGASGSYVFSVGAFNRQIFGLSPGTAYYFRAKAHNFAGWAYGQEQSFTTITIPTVTTQPATNIGATSAAGNGNITSTGGENANYQGIRWGTSPGVYIYTFTDSGSFGTGAFTKNMTGLNSATKYYYQAMAHNSAGWAYGQEQNFTTPLPCQTHNVSGYAWSENIGWISFNCENATTTGNGVNFGVDINSSAGNFTGYAWSENIGWIDFAPDGPYPVTSPNTQYSACMDFPGNGQACDGIGNYKVDGWARALSYGGGWDGWIKLRGSNYDVSVASQTGDFSGYAWADSVIGWIKFNGANYKVTADLDFLNQPPDKPVGSDVDWNQCTFRGSAVPTFSWGYIDTDNVPVGTDPQTAYEIEVQEKDANFSDPKFNHLVTGATGGSTSYVLNLHDDDDLLDETLDPNDLPPTMEDYQLDWNTRYWWHVRVRDSNGNWSSWSNPRQSETASHASPWVDFTWSPSEPTKEETVEFDSSATESFGGTLSYLWTILSGTGVFVDGTTNADSSPHIQFSTLNNTVRLEVTDSDNYSCYNDKDVIVQLPLPGYKEIPPIFWLKKILASAGNLLTKYLKFATL